MKINRLYIAFLGMLALTLASCSSDDDYQRATVSGAQVYFPNTLGSTIETPADANSFTVPVNRINTSGALTVPLTITMSDGSIYTPAAQQVSFADGANTAYVTFNYNPEDVVFGDYYDISIAINGAENITDYGIATYNFKAGKTAWVDYGVAQYREDCITTFFGVDNDILEVPIQKNVVTEGIYRLVNPYGEVYPYNEPGDWDDTQDYYLTVNASDPDHVYVELSPTGMDWGYGMFSIQSLATLYISRGTATLEQLQAEHPEYFGTLKNGIISMPARSLVLQMADYNDGGWYTSNGSGLFTIALPGSRIADYSMEFNYLGRLTDASGNDFIRGKFKFGKDVYAVKYAIAPSDDDTDEVAAGIIDGSVASEEMKRADADAIEVPMDGPSGKYNLVVVIFDESGEAVSVVVFEVKYQSSQDSAETWTAQYVGNYTYTVKDYSSNQGGGLWEGTQEAVLYSSDTDESRFKIAPWADQEGEKGLIFEMDETGTLVVDGVETGYVDEEWGMVYATDFVTYEAADMPSYYEEGVFHFFLAYHDYDGPWAFVQDTFTITGAVSAPALLPSRVAKTEKRLAGRGHLKQVRRLKTQNTAPVMK